MTNSPSGQKEQTPPKQNPEPETPKDPPPQRERNFQRQNPNWNRQNQRDPRQNRTQYQNRQGTDHPIVNTLLLNSETIRVFKDILGGDVRDSFNLIAHPLTLTQLNHPRLKEEVPD